MRKILKLNLTSYGKWLKIIQYDKYIIICIEVCSVYDLNACWSLTIIYENIETKWTNYCNGIQPRKLCNYLRFVRFSFYSSKFSKIIAWILFSSMISIYIYMPVCYRILY